ncbi:hypothetical protein OIU76_022876 [Salix suchowensis]|nr:hypothetical protein OIU76_022876 [Salix suchowensis]
MASFSKMITRTDTEKRLSVPIKFLESLPPFHGGHAVDFRARDENAEVWTFQCSTRKKGTVQEAGSLKGLACICSRGRNSKWVTRVEFYEARNQTTDESPPLLWSSS